MTALAMVYTSSGFVVAADGRLRWGEEATLDQSTRQMETDHAQKIFGVYQKHHSVAYILTGLVLNKDGSFDLVKESARQVALLSGRKFQNCYSYISTLSDNLNVYIDKRGRSECHAGGPGPPGAKSTLATIFLAGYFNLCPFGVSVKFHHVNQSLQPPALTPLGLRPGESLTRGSQIVATRMYADQDPRFLEYVGPLSFDMSLKEGEKFACGYIEACKTPEAYELDPFCRHIGGHVHVAEVTPQGFRWRIPPVRKNR